MRRAQLLRLAGRMQRVPERHHATDAERIRVVGCRKMRRNTAAHRLAADEYARSVEMAPGRGDGGAITRLELLGPIGHAAPLLRVKEIECEDVDPTVRQALCEAGDECALLSGACAVREDERRVRRRAARRIRKDSSLSIAADVNRQFCRHTSNGRTCSRVSDELWLRVEEESCF